MANQIPEPEWMNKTFGKDPGEWSRAQLEVRAYLTAIARQRTVATYLEVHSSVTSTKIPSTGNAFQGAIGLLLGQVSLLESRRLGKPMMLSAVAVTNQLRPGGGFQTLIDELGWKGDWPTWLATVWKTYARTG
jgi:hypothetical protein